MSGSGVFNPYSKWLAIPPEDQPPNHYRLLGIPLFEADPEVIEAAADQRVGFLRKHQSGPHAADAGRLLNEVSATRLCLLNPTKKAAYDEQLRGTPGEFQIEAAGTFAATPKRNLQPTLIIASVLAVAGVGLIAWLMTKPAPRAGVNTQLAKRTKSGSGKSGENTAHPSSQNVADSRSATKQPRGDSSVRSDKNKNGQGSQTGGEAKSATDTFRAPQGTLTAEAEMPAKSQPAAQPAGARATTPTSAANPADAKAAATSPSPTPDKPAAEATDAKLLAAIAQLDKATQIVQDKFFKKLKSRLAECREPPKKQKGHSPPLLAELDKMLAACDRNEFPPMRVQGTKSFNGHDYAFVSGNYTWNVARELCEAMGGHLATLTPGEEAAFVETTFLRPNAKSAYLGAGDQAKEGEWHWVTGEPWNFPAGINNDYGFAHALTWWSDLGFHDYIGDHHAAYVCEWESMASPELIALGSDTRIFQALWETKIQARLDHMEQRQKRFKVVHQAAKRIDKETGTDQGRGLYVKFGFEAPPLGPFEHKKSEYFLFREAKTWHEAEAHCERMGGHLVILNDPAEGEEVFRQVLQNGISVFIGCSDEYKEGQWRWLNGQPVKLRMSLDNFHDHDHVGFVEVKDKKATAYDMPAGGRSAYVCEWELD